MSLQLPWNKEIWFSFSKPLNPISISCIGRKWEPKRLQKRTIYIQYKVFFRKFCLEKSLSKKWNILMSEKLISLTRNLLHILFCWENLGLMGALWDADSGILGVVNLSQNAVLKKILKILQAVKTSRLTNLHIVYLATSNCLDSQKKQIWWRQ